MTIRIGKPLSPRQKRLLDEQEGEFHGQVSARMRELIARGVPEQDAFEQAWVDCGGLIIPDKEPAPWAA